MVKTGPSNTNAVLDALRTELAAVIQSDARNVYEYGRILAAVHKVAAHGQWGPFIESFGISETSSRNYMLAHTFKIAVQRMALKSAKFADLKLRPSAIYQLAVLHDNLPDARLWHQEDGVFLPVKLDDIVAVLEASKEQWISPARLEAIIRERHPEVEPEEEKTEDQLLSERAVAAVEEWLKQDRERRAKGEKTEEPEKEERQRTPPKGEEHQAAAPRADLLSFNSYVEGLWDLRDLAPERLRADREKLKLVIKFLTKVLVQGEAGMWATMSEASLEQAAGNQNEIPIDQAKQRYGNHA